MFEEQNLVLYMSWFIVTGIGFIGVLWFLLFRNKANNVSTEFDWEPVFKWQAIALAVNGLTKSGDLTISFNVEIYTVTLLGKIKAFDGYLTYSLCEKNERLDLALKRLDHANLMKIIEMATKVGEGNDKA